MVNTPKGKRQSFLVFFPGSCFSTFFYLSIWNPWMDICTANIFLLIFCLFWKQNKITYFQHALFPSKSGTTAGSFRVLHMYINDAHMNIYPNLFFYLSLRKHLLLFLLQYPFCGKLRWKWTGLFSRYISCGMVFFTGGILLRGGLVGKKKPCNLFRQAIYWDLSWNLLYQSRICWQVWIEVI